MTPGPQSGLLCLACTFLDSNEPVFAEGLALDHFFGAGRCIVRHCISAGKLLISLLLENSSIIEVLAMANFFAHLIVLEDLTKHVLTCEAIKLGVVALATG